MAETASQVKNMFGDQAYQERARRALPILVRQAISKKPIFYEALADELGMSNPRNLNWVLGSVGVTLNEIARTAEWDEEIPHIQSLVINQTRKLPGSGFEGFLAERVNHYATLSDAQKRAYLEGYWQNIFAYPYWQEVIEQCGLKPVVNNSVDIVAKAKGKGGGGGEGHEHRALKEFIRLHPTAIGLSASFPVGTAESQLPSGDKIDVLFSAKGKMLAVEVKSVISNNDDLARGLFQCVKYRAVMEAERGFKSAAYSIDAILVVGLPFPNDLRALQNSLGVTVLEVIHR